MTTADQIKRLNDMLNKRKAAPDEPEVPEDEDFTAEGIDERERVSRFMKVIQKQEAELAKALRKEDGLDD